MCTVYLLVAVAALRLPAMAADPLPGAGINASALDSAGNMWVTGYVIDGNFPATFGALQPTFGGGVCGTGKINSPIPCTDAFVAKLDPAGKLLYFTYLGGSSDDDGTAIAVDSADNVCVAGFTHSPNFPTTAGAFQTRNASPGQTDHSYSQAPLPGGDCFVLKITRAGDALVYSTLVGGNAGDYALGLALDSAGNAYIQGITSSSDFPITGNLYLTGSATATFKTTSGTVQPKYGGNGDAFVTA
jgi:hypothetical protein